MGAARDADVFRMFSCGQGFMATVKCQWAFRVGCLADYIGIMLSLTHYMNCWEALALSAALVAVCCYRFSETSSLLFSSVSIVKYWRVDQGGNPEPDDPYDLAVPVGMFGDL